MTTRRRFLQNTGTALGLFAGGVPFTNGGAWWAEAGRAAQKEAAEGKNQTANDHVLVVVQLTGGNDGLNTVAPIHDPLYRKLRPTLALPEKQSLTINADLAFHPALKGFGELLEAGRMTIVQGVGYPNPDRSHFSSMDVWHTARRDASRRADGWIGRYLDASHEAAQNDGQPTDSPAFHLGGERQPLAVVGRRTPTPSARSIDDFKLHGGAEQQQRLKALAAEPRPEADDLLQFVQASTLSAYHASRRLQEASARRNEPGDYPNNHLGRQLRNVARLIDAGFTTRVYYVSLDGFDTHADQAGAHAALLSEWSGAVRSFMNDLTQRGHDRRVLLASFSEFGRRVQENASYGTDHGAAAPMFLVGGKLRPGVVGAHPKLDDLDDGDLKHHTDFRQVYASILEDWLGCPSEPILGERFAKLDLFPA